MKKTFISFLIVAALCFAQSASASIDAYKIFKKGLTLEKECRIFEARETFLFAIKMDPHNAGYLTHYGWFLHYHGFSEEAVSVFKRALPLAEDRSSLMAGLNWNLKAIGKQKLPLKNAALIVRRGRESVKIPPPAAEAPDTAGNSIEDTASLLKQKFKDSKNPEHLVTLFNVYMDRNDFSQAIASIEELYTQKVLDKPTRLKLARAYFWSGNQKSAEKEYRALISESPDSAFIHYELAELLNAEGRLDDAMEELEKALSIYPDGAHIKKRKAEILAKQGKKWSADAVVFSIRAEGHTRLTALMAEARAFHFSGRLAEARTAYMNVLNEYPYNKDALWGLSETSIYTGNYRTAKSIIDTWDDAGYDPRMEQQMRLLALSEAPALEIQGEHYTNSSDYTRNNFGSAVAFNAGHELRLKTGYCYSGFSQDGFDDVTRHSLHLQGRQKLSNTMMLNGRLAYHDYDNDSANLNGGISLEYHHSKTFLAEVGYRHFDVIDTVLPFNNTINSYVVTIGSVGLDIQSNDTRLYLLHSPSQGVSLAGEVVRGKYTDGNRKTSLMFDASYEARHNPDVRLAYTYFYLDFEDPADTFTEGSKSEAAYWDPINFDAHTLRVEYRHEYNTRITYGGKAALSYIPKSSGTATALSVFGIFSLKDDLALRLDARWFDQDKGIDRVGKTGRFWARNFNASLNYRF